MVKHAPFAKEHVQNYRPISLLPIVSKVLERCVLNGTKAHLYQVISPLQHGFCTGRSCVTNLLEAFDYIGSLLDSGSQVDTIYLDMSKAFNKVSHRRLIHKLSLDGFGSIPTYRVAANASRYSATLRRIFLLPLEYLRALYLDRPSSSYTLMTFPKLSLAVE